MASPWAVACGDACGWFPCPGVHGRSHRPASAMAWANFLLLVSAALSVATRNCHGCRLRSPATGLLGQDDVHRLFRAAGITFARQLPFSRDAGAELATTPVRHL